MWRGLLKDYPSGTRTQSQISAFSSQQAKGHQRIPRYLFQQPKEHVSVNCSLMRLIQHDDRSSTTALHWTGYLRQPQPRWVKPGTRQAFILLLLGHMTTFPAGFFASGNSIFPSITCVTSNWIYLLHSFSFRCLLRSWKVHSHILPKHQFPTIFVAYPLLYQFSDPPASPPQHTHTQIHTLFSWWL